ncbi:hypothetical protein AAFF_G00149890 [Aldrovandia affinis]|uniref:Uncharacterized protein n=1 Tax=Aldrovandia affinis TaxID=143900 RepID=A0AAD7W900_9TELE|nr:hypothetical protein AAFF_G00149890 [Aldrovandia affinis]
MHIAEGSARLLSPAEERQEVEPEIRGLARERRGSSARVSAVGSGGERQSSSDEAAALFTVLAEPQGSVP